MKNKNKIALLMALAAAFLWSGSAKADYWMQHTRSTSGDVLPEHFELENMTKSSSGVRFLYGNDRVNMSDESSFVRHLVKYDGTNWSDETSAVEAAAGYSDIEFLNMYADANGNIWMPNRRDPNVALIKYNGVTGEFEKITDEMIAQDVGIGGINHMRVKNIFGNRNDNNLLYAVAYGDDRLYLLIYNISQDKWSDSGYSGGPLDDSGNFGSDIWGMYNETDNSFWVYQYHSSENEFSNPSGGDQGIGIWKYKNGSWTHYDSSDTTSDGVALKNGITDAFVDSSGNVWVGTRYGVFRYDVGAGTWANWTKDNSNIFTNRVIKIQEDSDGRVWIIALENENEEDDNGGISIYRNDTGEWEYYTSYNGEDALSNATNIFMIGGDEAWMFTGHGEEAMTAGIYALTRDDSHTALYGQVAGITLEKASLNSLKKATSKKVTIWKHTKVKRKWKKKKVIYRGRATDNWYKALNMTVSSNLRYTIKISGKKLQRIHPTSGEPIRLDFN
jgi:hypothetical protein